MPNNGHYTLCPYYRSERNKSITCEDAYHRFRYLKNKWEWMAMYCDADWQNCPFATELNEMYEKMERGDEMAEEKHNAAALKRELDKVSSMLGRCEKSNQAKDDEIKKLRKKNRVLEDHNNRLRKQLINVKKENEDYSKILGSKIDVLTRVYEDRMAYMIAALTQDGKLRERDVEKWAEGKRYALVHDKDESGEIEWKVVYDED